MKTSFASRLVYATLALTFATVAARADISAKYDPKNLVTPPLHAIPKVTPQRSVLKNGMVLYLLEDHSLPIVRGTVYFKSSSTWVPADKVGLGEITATAMRSGGSASKTGDYLDDRLGGMGAAIGVSLNSDLGNANFNCLAENVTEVLGDFAEVLRRPAFPEDKIELAKVGQRRAIAGRNDDMIPMLSRVAAQAVYGKDSPYARTPEYATVEAVTRDDCVKMHDLCFAPDRAIMVVYGDFKSADVKKTVTNLFGDWKKATIPPPARPPLPALGTPRLVFAPKEDVTQSGVVLCHLGFKADDPDYADMDVLDQALGGGFQSRLFNKIRTQRGLAYSAGSNSGVGFIRPGVFLARSLTRNDSVMAALDVMKQEVVRVTKEPLSDEEARIARESVENSLVFAFEKPSDVVFRAAFYEAAGYPADFLQKYQEALKKVTPATMLAAAQRKIHPDNLLTVIVGKEKEFDRPLESLGLPVDRVDITIPPPASKVKAAAATPAALATGKQWLKKAADAAGGAAAWAGVKSWSSEASANISMQGQTIALGQTSVWRLPDHRLTIQKLPMGEMSQGFDGQNGWRKGFGQLQDQPAMAADVKEEYTRSLFNLFAHGDQLEVQALDDKTVDGVTYHVGLVKSDLIRDWQLFFAPDGKLARMEFMDKGPNGDATFTSIYDDWRAVGSIQYPYANQLLIAGDKFMDAKLTDAKVNPTLGDDVFKKPTN